MLLNAVATACRLDEQLDLPLREHELVEFQETAAPPSWQDLFLARAAAIRAGAASEQAGSAPRVILSGAFNPLHAGHRRMAEIAEGTLGLPTAMEISILNV